MTTGQWIALGVMVAAMAVSFAMLLPDFLRWLKEEKQLRKEKKNDTRTR